MAQVPQFINWLTNTPIAIDTSMLLGGTFTQNITVNPATGAASITLNSQQASQQAYILFQQTGVSKWQLGKQTDDSFFFFDSVANKDCLRFATGPIVTFPNSGINIAAGADNQIKLTQVSDATNYNVVSLNGNVTSANLLGLEGGANADTNLYINSPAGHVFRINGNTIFNSTSTSLVPQPDNTISLGSTANRWASTSTVQLFTQAPATLTGASGSVTSESLIINASVSFTLTLPVASSNTGRWLNIKSIVAQTIGSASSNVVPLASATAGTVILSAGAGKWAHLQSDGSNWVIMAGVT